MRAATRKHTTISLEKNQTRKCSVSLNCSICMYMGRDIARQTNKLNDTNDTRMSAQPVKVEWWSNFTIIFTKKENGRKKCFIRVVVIRLFKWRKKNTFIVSFTLSIVYVMITCATRVAGAHLAPNRTFKTIFFSASFSRINNLLGDKHCRQCTLFSLNQSSTT